MAISVHGPSPDLHMGLSKRAIETNVQNVLTLSFHLDENRNVQVYMRRSNLKNVLQ